MSVSDDVSDELGGGTLQLWRVNDLIYREEAEVLAELDKHRQVGPQCFPPSSSAVICGYTERCQLPCDVQSAHLLHSCGVTSVTKHAFS